MRKPIIAGNWKMYKTISEAESLVAELKLVAPQGGAAEIVLCPPFTALAAVARAAAGTGWGIGAQNMFWEGQGAFTGEVSPAMLRDAGCTYVIVGHSERRQYFGETDATVRRKAQAAVAAGLRPIICVGESLAQREAGETELLVTGQVKAALEGLSIAELAQVVIAYEPIWAIGTGRNATPADADAVCGLIRQTVGNLFGTAAAAALRIQYGGSVKPENSDELLGQPNIDGALVGGASLTATSFARIIAGAAKQK